MKNICFFNSNKAWGGGEKWHHDIALRLRNEGYRVLVMTNKRSELFHRLEQERIPLRQIRISNLSFLNIFKLITIGKTLKAHQINTIFLNLPSDVKTAGIAAKLAGVEKIIYRRGTALPVSNTVLNRWLLRHVITRVIANSEEIQQTILQNNSKLIPKEKITVIYNGIDLNAYDQKKTKSPYPRGNGEIIVGNAGRLVGQKGQKYLVELARILKEQGVKFKLLIAGKGKLEKQLKEYSRELGVENEIVFLGFVENIKSFMENIDIFLLSSFHEGSANVLMEAMAAKKPVVAFNVSSNPEIVVHGETGFLVEQGNITDFAKRVEELIYNEHRRREFGLNARKQVEEKFNIQRMVKEVTTLIEE